ncbi:hypothetical protein [Nocardioides bruguierae]|uniref:Uncharacterized protein n=1 Tax=Nocardioides bruguierae TaxID=2945102 RepID=A0A9X2DB98_9ACTN|nr:hypothetical protein [Nocardioides bruguierae]MCM0622520.1 hypothetical protein [Nocardioides bruguierae]
MELLRRIWRDLTHAAGDLDSGPCAFCGTFVGALQGERAAGRIYCSETCADDDWAADQV